MQKFVKPNHFARSRACNKKAVSELQAEQSEEYHLLSVTNSSSEAPGRVSVKINGTDHRTSFKIDTGADVSTMSLQTYNMLPKPLLQKAAAVLSSPGETLDCKGKIEVTARFKGVDYPLQIYVVSSVTVSTAERQQQEWGSSAMLTLKPEKTIFSELDENHVKCAPVKIRLKDDSQPYSPQTARRVPIPLLQKVKDELFKMEETGQIQVSRQLVNWQTKVERATDTRANRLVCRCCDSAKERGWGADLHWLQKAERCDQAWKIRLTDSWRHPSQTEGIYHLYQVGCQEWILANSTGWWICQTHYIYQSIWPTLLLQIATGH